MPLRWTARTATLYTGVVGTLILGALLVGAFLLQSLAPGLPDAERIAWVGAAVLFGAVIGSFALRSLRLARQGLALEAAEDGITLRLRGRVVHFPWSNVDRAAAEARDVWGARLPVLAVHVTGASYRIPRSLALGGSDPTCLCVVTDVVGWSAEEVATALNAARDRHRSRTDGATYEPASGEPPTPGEPGPASSSARRRSRLMQKLVDLYGEEAAGRLVVGIALCIPAVVIMLAMLVITGDLLTAFVIGFGATFGALAVVAMMVNR